MIDLKKKGGNFLVQNVPSGSITSGYPIRTQPNVSVYQGRPPSPQVSLQDLSTGERDE